MYNFSNTKKLVKISYCEKQTNKFPPTARTPKCSPMGGEPAAPQPSPGTEEVFRFFSHFQKDLFLEENF